MVAVKVLSDQSMSEEALKEFRTEVTMMSKMRHPNVVLLMGICSSAPNLAIVTEYLARGSLYRLLHHTEVKLDDRRRVKMGIDIAKGMAYLHSASPPIVHRDLKSPNLLVVREHTPHDFPPLLHPIDPTTHHRRTRRSRSRSAISGWRASRRIPSLRQSTAAPARPTTWRRRCCGTSASTRRRTCSGDSFPLHLGRRTKGGVLPSWFPCRLFLGPGFRLGARWNRLGEAVKTRK